MKTGRSRQETLQGNARVRQRAMRRLVARHPDEYAVLLHEEQHADNQPHIHWPKDHDHEEMT